MPTHLHLTCSDHPYPVRSTRPVGLVADVDAVLVWLSHRDIISVQSDEVLGPDPHLLACAEFLRLHRTCEVGLVDDDGGTYDHRLAEKPAPEVNATVLWVPAMLKVAENARQAWARTPNTHRLSNGATVVLDFSGSTVTSGAALAELVDLIQMATTDRRLVVVDLRPVHPIERPAAELREILARQGIDLGRLTRA